MQELISIKGNIPIVNMKDEDKDKGYFKLAIHYFLLNNISIMIEDLIILKFTVEDYIDVYTRQSSYIAKKGVISCTGKIVPTEITNLILKDMPNRNDVIKSMEDVIHQAVRYLYYIFTSTKYPHKDKMYKLIKTDDYTKITIKETRTEIIYYPKSDTRYTIRDKGNKVEVLENTYHRFKKVIPSSLYPLSNKDYRIFTANNTTDLKDDTIAHLLNNCTFKQGFCYSNSQLILDTLTNYNGKVQYYSGWVLFSHSMTHHAWIVINDTSVIDVSIRRAMLNMPNMLKCEEEGIPYKGKSFIDYLIDDIKSNKPFKEQFLYGQVSEQCIYVGTPTTAQEARDLYNNLIEKMPNHPDYLNLNANGSNSTLETLYKRL